jgi:hypothetical protein
MEIGNSVKDSLWDSLRVSVYDPCSIPIRDCTYKLIYCSAWVLILGSVQDSVKNSIWIPINNEVWYRARKLK